MDKAEKKKKEPTPGEIIRGLMEPMSHGELARRIGYTRQHISSVLDGRSPVTYAFAEKLASFFGVAVSTLIDAQRRLDERAHRERARPQLRYTYEAAAKILAISRSAVYRKAKLGELRTQRDGARKYITHAELERYVRELGNAADGGPVSRDAPF